MLPVKIEIRGIAYENRRITAQQVEQGDEVHLVRDYDNPVDTNAIKAIHQKGELGFVPRETAQLLALEIDTGFQVAANITEIVPGKVPKIKILISEVK